MSKLHGVDGTWSTEFGPWHEGLTDYFKLGEAIPLAILVWGPGEHQEQWHPKRLAIIEDLEKNPYNDVKTSEDLFRLYPEFEAMPLHRAEEAQAELADVIIALFVDDESVTGAPGEILLFGDRDDLQTKIHVLKPEGWKTHSFLAQTASEILPTSQYLNYTEDEYESCIRMRGKCREWVEGFRASKYRRLRREHA